MSTRSQGLFRGALTLLAGSLLASAALAADGDYTRTYKHALAVKPGDVLRVANLAGTIRVVAGKSADLVVEATIHGSGPADIRGIVDAMAFVQSHDKKGRPEWALSYPVDRYDGFAYPTRDGHGSSWFDNSRTNLEYMGRRVSIYSRERSGSPTLYADLKLELPSSGAIVMRNGSGSVHGERLAGDFGVDTGSGDVEIAGFDGKLMVDTGSGSVRIFAGANASFDLEADQGSGDLVVGYEDAVYKRHGREIYGAKRGDGKTRIRVDTGSGDCVIKPEA